MPEDNVTLPTAIDNPSEVVEHIEDVPEELLQEFDDCSDESEE